MRSCCNYTALHRIDYILNICDQYLSNEIDDYALSLPVISLENIQKEVLDFVESYTKRTKFDIIKQTVLFREKALRSFEYGCIRGGRFIYPQIIKHPNWKLDIEPILLSSNILDIGCCFGTDIRYCINYGCNPKQVLGVDIERDFIDLGFDYFGDRDILHNRFIIINVINNNGQTFIDKALKMNNNSLFDIVQISNVYHLLTKKEGEIMMKVAVKLVNKSKGIIFGSAMGCKNEGVSYRKDKLRYLHSKSSFEKLMKECGNFEDLSIRCNPLPPVSKKLLDKFSVTQHSMLFTFFGRISKDII